MLFRLLRTLYGIYAALVFAVVIFPLCLLIIIGPTLAIRRATGRAGVKLALLLMGSPIVVRGLENLPKTPCICVSNHASYLDGLVLTAALPARFTFMVQHGAAAWPLVGKTIQRMGVSFVNRVSAREAAAATRELLRRVDAGESFTIFPEGTFRRRAALLPFHSGAFMIASRANVAIAPVAIRGTRAILTEGDRLPWRSLIHIEVLPAIAPTGSSKDAMNALREASRNAILSRCGEPDSGLPPSLAIGEASTPA